MAQLTICDMCGRPMGAKATTYHINVGEDNPKRTPIVRDQIRRHLRWTVCGECAEKAVMYCRAYKRGTR